MKDSYLKITATSWITETVDIDRSRFCDEIHRLINCDVWEGVPFHVDGIGSFYMILDENGKISEPPKPFNPIATFLYNNRYDVIVGDVIVCELKYVPSDEPGIEEELDCCPIEPAKLYALLEHIRKAVSGE